MLGIVKGFGAQVEDGADGAKQIALPNGQTIHVKEANGWAYVGQTEAALASLPADPAAELEQDRQPTTTSVPASPCKTSPSSIARWRSRP